MNATFLATDPDREVDTPVRNRRVVPAKEEGLVGLREDKFIGVDSLLDKAVQDVHHGLMAANHGGGSTIL